MKYDVVLCTYNGEKYIKEQLESILAQTISPEFILISDDGSSDSTIDRIHSTMSENSFEKYSVVAGPRNGVAHNFFSAIHHTSSNLVFFSDQDDIWLKNKAEIFTNKARSFSSKAPFFIFSDAYLIDEEGSRLRQTFFENQRLDPSILKDDSILYQNCVQGASLLVNRALLSLVEKSLVTANVNQLVMHDWWIAIIGKYYGSYKFINKPLIEYRQHENNVIGSRALLKRLVSISSYISRLKLVKSQIREFEYFSSSIEWNDSVVSSISHPKLNVFSRIKAIIVNIMIR